MCIRDRLRHLQRAGHRVLALVGGATGMIGDPQMSGERVLNSRETVDEWIGRLKTQISSVLDFDGDNPATMVNNLDWTGGLTAIDFLRDVGQHYRLGTMLAKDTVAQEVDGGQATCPVQVVDHGGRVVAPEVQDAGDLRLQPADPLVDRLS